MKKYDIVPGIKKYVEQGLLGLNQLRIDRHIAGYENDEDLHEFILLGRWKLDRCGNFMKIEGDIIPALEFSNMPAVMPYTDFLELAATKFGLENFLMCCKVSSDLPSVGAECEWCSKPWGLHNCYDVIITGDYETINGAPFIGMPLHEVANYFHAKSGRRYQVSSGSCIRNDRFINLEPMPDFPELRVNKKGWVGLNEGIADDYTIQDGDELSVFVWKFYHSECRAIFLEMVQKKQFKQICKQAGFKNIKLKAVPNKYCQHRSCCAPWFVFNYNDGQIKIGWRKRVINIDWSGSNWSLRNVGNGDDVTTGIDYIHAWGYDKAVEYLNNIYKQIQ